MNSQLARELEQQFLIRDYQWNFGDETRNPTEKDFLKAFETAKTVLKDGQSVFIGRLVISKSGGHTDVYLHLGEIE